MMVSFFCLMCEMARSFDPFARWGIWSNETLRSFLTLEVFFMLAMLLVASDAAAWWNYFAVESLLLKPQRRYRHAVYVGAVLLLIQSILLIGVSNIQNEYTRGMTIGWLLSGIIMVIIGVVTMIRSLREVDIAIKLEEKTFFENEEVGNAVFFQSEYKEDDDEKRVKSRKKSLRITKYLLSLGLLFIFDLCFGSELSGGQIDFLHLLYDIALKIMLAVMLVQRRPIKGARTYEIDIHTRYKPFDETIFSGCDATRTVFKLQEMVRDKTTELAQREKKAMQKASENHEYNPLPTPPAVPEENLERRSDSVPLQALEMTETHVRTEEASSSQVRVIAPIEVINSNSTTSKAGETTKGQSKPEAGAEEIKSGPVTELKTEGLSDETTNKEPSNGEAGKPQSYHF